MTISELRDELGGGVTAAYREKQLHPVPDLSVKVREAFLLDRAKGKVVLDIGASGPMHEAIVRVAATCYGIDKPDESADEPYRVIDNVYRGDLDQWGERLPRFERAVELVICGEVIEHLSNPGWLLDRLRHTYKGIPLIITVPNAHSDGGRRYLERGIECVNREHVAYYSYHTLLELTRRHGYELQEAYWYNGRAKFSEGLIFVVQ